MQDHVTTQLVPRYLYRALRAGQCPTRCLEASAPEGADSLAQAIAYGSGTQGSRFIHTSHDPLVAVYFAEAWSACDKTHQVVRIDLEGYKGAVYDVSTADGCSKYQVDGIARSFAMKHKEVCLLGSVAEDVLRISFCTAGLALGSKQCSFDDFERSVPQDTLQKILRNLLPASQSTRSRSHVQMLMVPMPPEQCALSVGRQPREAMLQAQGQRLDKEESFALAKLEALQREINTIAAKRKHITNELQALEGERAAKQRAIDEEQRAKEQRDRAVQRGESFYVVLEKDKAKHLRNNWQDDAICYVLMQDWEGYMAVQDDGSCLWAGQHSGLSSSIKQCWKKYKVHPILISVGDDDRFFVEYSGGYQRWKASDDFSSAIKFSDGTVQSMQCVAFAPDGGWFVKWENGQAQWSGLPESLHNVLNGKWCKQNGSPCHLAVTPGGGWFAWWDVDGSAYWEHRGIPSYCAETIAYIKKKQYSLKSVQFGADESWFIRYSYS